LKQLPEARSVNPLGSYVNAALQGGSDEAQPQNAFPQPAAREQGEFDIEPTVAPMTSAQFLYVRVVFRFPALP
jgi:hypothetical protein